MSSMGLHVAYISPCRNIWACRAPLGPTHTNPMGNGRSPWPSTCRALQRKARNTLTEVPKDLLTPGRTPDIDDDCVMRGHDVGLANAHGQMEQGFSLAEGARQGQFPPLLEAHPGLHKVDVEPPVYIITDFLTDEECRALTSAAKSGELREVEYNDAVLLDAHKLWPLSFIVLAGAMTRAFSVLTHGGTWEEATNAGLSGFLAFSAGAAALSLAGQALAQAAIRGRVFTGTKWAAPEFHAGVSTPAGHAALGFVSKLARLLKSEPALLEHPTVTRYRVGQCQRVHIDARPLGDSSGAAAFMEAGGQRLAQCVVYLNTVPHGSGGATRFHHAALGGLSVQPHAGDALVFFTAAGDGTPDFRMTHSGEPVLAGEKWIVNTWLCQRPVAHGHR